MKLFCYRAGTLLCFCAIGLGAFGAHALKDYLDPKSQEIFKTAVQYHLPHAIFLTLLPTLGSVFSLKYFKFVGISLALGIIIFSGSLYLLAITGATKWGALTPIGGVLLLLSWLLLFTSSLTKNRE